MSLHSPPRLPVARENALVGRGVVITRPQEQARALAALVQQHGGRPILFPVIEISEPADPDAVRRVVERLDSFDIAVFVSPVAVNRGMAAIAEQGSLPDKLTVAAVGGGSARALAAHGVKRVVSPRRGADSESLLECPELRDVAGKRIVIFRGDGGRELLSDTLTARGASVEYAHCYRRGRPTADGSALVAAFARSEIDAFVVTSSQGLRNLYAMLGAEAQALLADTPVFVPHPRIAAAAREFDLHVVIESASGDEGMMNALIEYFSRD